MEQIWEEIELIEIDCVSESEYESVSCSEDYVFQMEEDGELLWRFLWGRKRTFWGRMRVAFLTALVLVGMSTSFPLLGLSNWGFVGLIGFISAVTLIAVGFGFWKMEDSCGYFISTKKVGIYDGTWHETTYENIQRVSLKRSLFAKASDTVSIKVKKGRSVWFTLRKLSEAEEVYRLIMEHLQERRET